MEELQPLSTTVVASPSTRCLNSPTEGSTTPHQPPEPSFSPQYNHSNEEATSASPAGQYQSTTPPIGDGQIAEEATTDYQPLYSFPDSVTKAGESEESLKEIIKD